MKLIILLILSLPVFGQYFRDTIPAILLSSDTSSIDKATVISGVMNSGYVIYSSKQYTFYLRGYVVRNRSETMTMDGVQYIWIPTGIYLDENKKPLPKSVYVWMCNVK